MEGFGQKTKMPKLVGLVLLGLEVLGRTDDDADILGPFVMAQGLEDVEAVDLGHHKIQNDEIGAFGEGQVEAFLAVAGVDDFKVVALQDAINHSEDDIDVFSYEDLGFVANGSIH